MRPPRPPLALSALTIEHGIPGRLVLGALWRACPRLAVRWQTIAVCTIAAASLSVFSWLSIAQHHAYNTHAYDLSWFDQTAWNTARGDWLANSFSHGTYLKEHFSPILLLTGVIYRFWSAPESLLFIQAAVAAAASIPLYIGVTYALHSRNAALMFAVAYLLSPHLHGYLLFDFHPDVFAVLFVFVAFAFLAARRPSAALLALIPAFLVKEDVALVGIGFAVLLSLLGYPRHGRRLLVASVLFMALAEVVILLVPLLLHWGTSGEAGRYNYLLRGGLNDPKYVWQHLTGPLQREALLYMFGSQAMLPLAGPGVLVPAADLLANVLADHKPQLQLTLQYPLYPLALMLLASVVNIRILVRWNRVGAAWASLRIPANARAPFLAGIVLIAETASWLIGSPLGFHISPARFRTTAHTAALNRIVQVVPAAASVSAQSSILPHLSERENIREFPYIDHAAYVVIDRKGFVAWDSEMAGYSSVLATLPERGYCLTKADDGVELWAVDDLCEAR
jgi:uncharacterized membrane protein